MSLEGADDIVKLAGGLLALATALIQVGRWYAKRRQRARLEARLGKKKYAVWDIKTYTRHYLEPDCQSLDPGGADEPRLIVPTRERAFSFLDRALASDSEFRHIIVLADSGMGKSALLLNYYLRSRGQKFHLWLFPVSGLAAADLAAIPDPDQTVLMLDALDEDTAANTNLDTRLRALLALTEDFRKVLITCRTQFFAKDDEIPSGTGQRRHGPRAAGQSAEYFFHKVYLSPFSDEQVEQYLRRRYGWLHRKKRKQAAELVKKIPNIAVRPMLLAHVDSLIGTTKPMEYTYQLYEEMIDAWLTREEGSFPGVTKQALWEFSELLALDLYQHREKRGSERIPRTDVARLAKQWAIPIEDWQLTSRSLLNRDAEGNYKFAHRSIMEYLFVRRFVASKEERLPGKWTDQMQSFLVEMLRSNAMPLGAVWDIPVDGVGYPAVREKSGMTLAKVDLSGTSLRGCMLAGAVLNKANLDGADLGEAHLNSANLEGATLNGARLDSARLENVAATQACFADAILTGSGLTGAVLVGAKMPRANLDRAVLKRARLEGSDLRGASLVNADLDEASLERANLTGCNLTGVRFDRVKLWRAIIREVTGLSREQALNASYAGADVDPSLIPPEVSMDFPLPPLPLHASAEPAPGQERAFCDCGSGRYEVDCHGVPQPGPS